MTTTTLADEVAYKQIQLISSLDTLSNSLNSMNLQNDSFTSNFSSTFFNLHYILSNPSPSTNFHINSLNLLHKVSQSDISLANLILKTVNDQYDQLELTYTEFSSFVNNSLNKIILANYIICEISKTNPLSTHQIQESYSDLISKILTTNKIVLNSEQDMATNYSLFDIQILIPDVTKSILDCISKITTKTCADSIGFIKQKITNFRDSFILSISNSFSYLPELQLSSIIDFRQFVSDLCYFSGIIDENLKKSVASPLASKLLYLVDELLNYYSIITHHISNPLTVTDYSKIGHESIAKVLGSSSNAYSASVEPQLFLIDKFFSDMTPAFEDTTALKGTVEQLIDFLDKNKPKFIDIQRVLAYGGYKSQSRIFYSSLVGLEITLKSLLMTSKGQSTTFSPDKILEFELNYKKDIDQIKTSKKSICYADIISLYTNPSKLAQLPASNNKNEKEIFEIAKISISKVKVLLNNITDLSEKTIPLLQTIQNYLKSCWPALDFQKIHKKSQKKSNLLNDYNELCYTFNLVVEGMQTAILIPITDIPLRELCFEASNLLNLICKNSSKIIPKNIQLLCDNFKKLQQDFSIERLFKLNLQKYIDDLEKNIKEIMKLDSSNREICFTKQIPILIEFLKTISLNILNFKKEVYEVKDANLDLAHSSDGISKIIFSLSETEFNLNSFYLMNILVRLREHISSIRCGVIFDTPKDFLSTIKTIYDQISDLQSLVKVFCPLTSIKPFISSLEIVIWKLSHMKGDYKNDDLLISSLNAAIEHLSNVYNNIKDKNSKMKQNCKKIKQILEKHLGYFNDMSSRTNEQYKKLHNDFNDALQSLSKEWNPPENLNCKNDLNLFQKSLNLVNLLCSQPDLVNVSFLDPLEIIKSTPLENFIRQAMKAIPINEIYKIVKTAISIEFPSKLRFLKQSVIFIENCIVMKGNYNIKSYVEHVSVILASSLVVGYNNENELLNVSSNLDMYYHAYNILSLASPSDAICDAEIFINLMNLLNSQITYSNLPHLYYYISRLSDMYSNNNILKDFQKIILSNSKNISEIDFTSLKNHLPTLLPQEFNQYINNNQNERDFIFKTKPFYVSQKNLNENFVPTNFPKEIFESYMPLNKVVHKYFPKPKENLEIDENVINEFSYDDNCQKTFSVHQISSLISLFSNTSKPLDLKFRKLSNISNSMISNFPESIYSKGKGGYLSITVTSFKSRKNIVSLYLYDVRKKMIVSQPFSIGIIDSLPIILNTSSLTAFIEISERNPNVVLIARLLSQLDDGGFKHSAVSSIKIFNEGGFLEFNPSFPDRFHSISNNSYLDDKNVNQFIDNIAIDFQEVTMTLKIRLLLERPINSDTFWSKNRFPFTFMPRIDNNLIYKYPLIILKNVTFQSEVKDAKLCYFTVEIIDQTNIYCLNQKNELQKNFKSCLAIYNQNMTFPDICQILVTKDFSHSAVCKISFRTVDKKGIENNRLFTTFKFFNQNDFLLQNNEIRFCLNDEKNKSLALFQETSSYVNLSISFPSNFVIPKTFVDFYQSNGIKTPFFRGMSLSLLEPLFIPTIFVFLKTISEKNVRDLVLFLSNFSLDCLESFNQWCFGCFNPNYLPVDFISKFLNYYSNYVSECNSKNDYLEQLRCIKSMPYILDILLSLLLFSNDIIRFHKENLAKMCQGLSKIISLLARMEFSRIANERFCNFLFYLSGTLDEENLSEIILTHLNSFDNRSIELFSMTAFPSSQDPEQIRAELLPLPIRSLSMLGQFNVFHAFAMSPFLTTVAVTFPKYRQIFSILFSKLDDAIATNNLEFIRQVLQINAKFIENSDSFTSISDISSQIFFPYLDFAAKYCTNNNILDDAESLEYFITPILFLIKTSSPSLILQTVTDKNGKEMVVRKLIGFLYKKFSESEFISPLFLAEFTKRLIRIFSVTMDSENPNKEMFREIAEYAHYSLAKLQPSFIVKQSVWLYCKVVDYFPDQYQMISTLVSNILPKINRKMDITRNSILSFFVHVFYSEYLRVKNIDKIFDIFLSEFLFNAYKSLEFVYYEFLTVLSLFLTSFPDEQFVKIVSEKLSNTKKNYLETFERLLKENDPLQITKIFLDIHNNNLTTSMINLCGNYFSENGFYMNSFYAKIEEISLLNSYLYVLSNEEIKSIGGKVMQSQQMFYDKQKILNLLNEIIEIVIKSDYRVCTKQTLQNLIKLQKKFDLNSADFDLTKASKPFYYFVTTKQNSKYIIESHISTMSEFASFMYSRTKIVFVPSKLFTNKFDNFICPVTFICKDTFENENYVFNVVSSLFGFHEVNIIADKKSSRDIDFYLERLNDEKIDAESTLSMTVLNPKFASKAIKRSKDFVDSSKKALKLIMNSKSSSVKDECESILKTLQNI